MAFRPPAAEMALATKIVDRVLDEAQATGVDPVLTPVCACGCPADDHRGPRHGGRCTTCPDKTCWKYRDDLGVLLAIRAMDARTATVRHVLRARDARKRAKRRNYGDGNWSVRASDLGTCRRALAYRNGIGGEVERDITDTGAALRGQMIEEFYVRALLASYPWLRTQVEVQIAGIPSPGRLDVYDPITGDLTEIKSAGPWRWDQVGSHGADLDHRGQALLYAQALERAGHKVRRVRVIYIEADKLRSEEFTWYWDDRARRLAEDARAVLLGHLAMLDIAAETSELPEQDRSGPTTDELCRNCPFRSACWNIPRAQELGRSPESVTKLGESPEDEAVERALSAVRDAYDARNAAEKLVKEVKAVIEGLPVGRYGRLQLVRGRAGGPNWKSAREQAVEYAETTMDTLAQDIGQIMAALPPDEWEDPIRDAFDEHAFDFEALTIPTNPSAAPSVRPVRKATLDAEERARVAAAAAAPKEPAADPDTPVDPGDAAEAAALAFLAELDLDTPGAPRPPQRTVPDTATAAGGAS